MCINVYHYYMASFSKNPIEILIIFLLVPSIANSQQQTKKLLTRNDFSIVYPSYLELDESGKEGSVFILSTQKQHQNDIFIENINLTTQVVEMEFDLFAKTTEERISSIATIIENKTLRIDDKECLRLVFQLVQNNVELTFIQHFYLANQKIYALTFSCETKEFENLYEEMNEVLMSFKLLV